MNVKGLYDKTPTEKQSQINVIGNMVLYDDGMSIYAFYLNGDILVPADVDSRNFLNSLGT